MHHFKAKGGTLFNFNSDLSGEVYVVLPDANDVATSDPSMPGFPLPKTSFARLNAADLLEFTEHVREQYPQNASDGRDRLAEAARIVQLLTERCRARRDGECTATWLAAYLDQLLTDAGRLPPV